MADQAINALSTKTAPETSDQLLLVGTGEPQLIDYDKLADAILNKITSKNYALDAGTMTLPAALNALNGNCKMFTILKDNVIVLRDPEEAKKYFESLTADSFPHFWLVYSVRGSEGTFFISKSTFVLGTILCWSFDAPQIRMLRCRNTEWLDSDWRTI